MLMPSEYVKAQSETNLYRVEEIYDAFILCEITIALYDLEVFLKLYSTLCSQLSQVSTHVGPIS